MELLILIVLLGLIFDFTNGFHDTANAVSTVIATRALRPITAIIMAACLNGLGGLHQGPVARTLTEGLLDPQLITPIMIAAAASGAILWNLITWYFGMPSSSSYALIGALLGVSFLKEVGIIHSHVLLTRILIPMVLSPVLGFFAALGALRLLRRSVRKENSKLSRHLQIGSSGLVALSHGLNDAQKSMALITLGLFSLNAIPSIEIPLWVVASCALMMGLGTLTGGMRIIRTVGFRITHLSSLQGSVAETSSALIILSATFLGMPISSTQVIVGSMAGSGGQGFLQRVNRRVMAHIALSWLLTLPGSALLAMLFAFFLSSSA